MPPPYEYIEKIDLSVHRVADPQTNEQFMVKLNVPDHEVESLQKASALTFPNHLKDTISIPKLISDNADDLPEALKHTTGNIMIMEIAKGEELKPYQSDVKSGRKTTSDFRIHLSDWHRFKDAIHFMNESGVIHKDLKNTENIFISVNKTGNMHFELIDWGGPTNFQPTSDLPDLEYLDQSLRSSGIISSQHPDSKINIDIQNSTHIDTDDIRITIQSISPKDIESYSPELQSLYEFRYSSDRFKEQWTELAQNSKAAQSLKSELSSIIQKQTSQQTTKRYNQSQKTKTIKPLGKIQY